MACKIDRVVTPDGFVTLRVSGRIDGIHVQTLMTLTDNVETTKVLTIDLIEVTLVSREAVEVLAHVETRGINLQNCPAYVREWVSREQQRTTRQKDNAT